MTCLQENNMISRWFDLWFDKIEAWASTTDMLAALPDNF